MKVETHDDSEYFVNQWLGENRTVTDITYLYGDRELGDPNCYKVSLTSGEYIEIYQVAAVWYSAEIEPEAMQS